MGGSNSGLTVKAQSGGGPSCSVMPVHLYFSHRHFLLNGGFYDTTDTSNKNNEKSATLALTREKAKGAQLNPPAMH
jgi:hypothetical protein